MDEAHRSQYGFGGKVNEKTGEVSCGFASNLRDALPNASFIGFTGTLIEKTDVNTRAGFGEDCGAVLADAHTPMILIGGVVFHLPFVKSGKSTGRLRSATDFSLSTAMELHVAAS